MSSKKTTKKPVSPKKGGPISPKKGGSVSSKRDKSKTKKDISKSVMSKIKKDQIKMKPKAYFILGSILLGLGVAVVLITATAFLTISAFHIRTSNPLGFLKYGKLGGRAFFILFPFRPLIVSLISIFGGLALLKKYDISYKKNFLGISLGLIAGLVTIAVAVDKVGVNDRLKNTKVLQTMYRQELTNKDMVMGEVISASESSMIIRNPRNNQEITLNWDENTTIQNNQGFEVGDRVGAVGEKVGEEFYAQGIHEGGMRWQSDQPPPPNQFPGRVKGTQNPNFLERHK